MREQGKLDGPPLSSERLVLIALPRRNSGSTLEKEGNFNKIAVKYSKQRGSIAKSRLNSFSFIISGLRLRYISLQSFFGIQHSMSGQTLSFLEEQR